MIRAILLDLGRVIVPFDYSLAYQRIEDLGGLPAWLLKTPASAHALRSDAPEFMQPVARWVHRLAQEVGPLQYGRGGPILNSAISAISCQRL